MADPSIACADEPSSETESGASATVRPRRPLALPGEGTLRYWLAVGFIGAMLALAGTLVLVWIIGWSGEVDGAGTLAFVH